MARRVLLDRNMKNKTAKADVYMVKSWAPGERSWLIFKGVLPLQAKRIGEVTGAES
jgi:hypothetical protein